MTVYITILFRSVLFKKGICNKIQKYYIHFTNVQLDIYNLIFLKKLENKLLQNIKKKLRPFCCYKKINSLQKK